MPERGVPFPASAEFGPSRKLTATLASLPCGRKSRLTLRLSAYVYSIRTTCVSSISWIVGNGRWMISSNYTAIYSRLSLVSQSTILPQMPTHSFRLPFKYRLANGGCLPFLCLPLRGGESIASRCSRWLFPQPESDLVVSADRSSCLGRFASLDGPFLAIGLTLPSVAVGGSGTLGMLLIDSLGGVRLESFCQGL